MRKLLLHVLVLSIPVLPTSADTLELLGVSGNKAAVSLNNHETMVLTPHTTVEGVKLVSTGRDWAEFIVHGNRYRMNVGGLAMMDTDSFSSGPPPTGKATFYRDAGDNTAVDKTVLIRENARGQYLVQGEINGVPVLFQVDTGASTIAMSHTQAERIGLAYKAGWRATSKTASGRASAFLGYCGEVSVSGIRLSKVECAVSEHDDNGMLNEVTLLGMSFLRRIKMYQERGTLVLSPY